MHSLVVNEDHRKSVMALESEILAQEQTHIEPDHYFSYLTYCRRIDMPEGLLLTGKIHRYPCTNMLVSGRVAVVTDEIRDEIVGPAVFESGAGVKKAIYAIEDSILITVHPWNGTDTLEELESKLIADSYEELDMEHSNKLKAMS